MTFQDIILKLNEFWSQQNALFNSPTTWKRAGTMNPATFYAPWVPTLAGSYVEPSRRPTDRRYGRIPTGFSIITSTRLF